ncbi:uncharacterized protein LY89DRAFT_742387 [Mollisia scopiformis]|uniref:Uncharacterized protein n=1 Tax=Mollisia scopiformis TaxID=149040 RepID=A0A132B775_MOLSC|nr:uncharacterized protein LY89DRAFT_742387 [Mollisia scopiformis]KUJ08093.1 hypothetical protein LY89DRAFT_742387 [Mollisia scopiformis]
MPRVTNRRITTSTSAIELPDDIFRWSLLLVDLAIVVLMWFNIIYLVVKARKQPEIYSPLKNTNLDHLLSTILYTGICTICYIGAYKYTARKVPRLETSYDKEKWLESIETTFKEMSRDKNIYAEGWKPSRYLQQDMKEFASSVTEPRNIWGPFSKADEVVNRIVSVSYVVMSSMEIYRIRCQYDLEPSLPLANDLRLGIVCQGMHLALIFWCGYTAGWRSEMRSLARRLRVKIDDTDLSLEWWKTNLYKHIRREQRWIITLGVSE